MDYLLALLVLALTGLVWYYSRKAGLHREEAHAERNRAEGLDVVLRIEREARAVAEERRNALLEARWANEMDAATEGVHDAKQVIARIRGLAARMRAARGGSSDPR